MASRRNALDSVLESLRLFIHPRVAAMLFLGFSAGVPILLIFSTLGLWLNEAGVAKSSITFFSWAALGYSFKFVWAPLVDRLPLPILTKLLGRRRAWMLVSQLAIMSAILLMSSVDPKAGVDSLTIMAYGAVLLGFSSATQDIVIDAYRIESAEKNMQSMLSATYIAGYRIGMLVAGAGGLFIASYLGSTKELYSYEAWSGTYMIMAAVMLIGVATTLIIKEPKKETFEGANFTTKGFLLFISIVSVFSVFFASTIYIFKLVFSLFNMIQIGYIDGLITGVIIGLYGLNIVTIYLSAYIFKKLKARIIDKRYISLLSVFLSFLSIVLTFILIFSTTSGLFEPAKGVLIELFGNKHLAGFFVETLRMALAFFGSYVVIKILLLFNIVDKGAVSGAYVEPAKDFFGRYGMSVAVLLLAVIGLYRVSDIVLGVVANIFYQDMGFTKIEIATVSKTFGLFMTLAGGFLGGFLAIRVGVFKVLFLGALLSALTNLLFIVLANVGHDITWLYVTITMDNLSAGIATTAFIAFLSSLTNIKFTAVQYAIFSSLMTLLPKIFGGYSGSIVEAFGYSQFFIITTLIGLPILYLVYKVKPYIN